MSAVPNLRGLIDPIWTGQAREVCVPKEISQANGPSEQMARRRSRPNTTKAAMADFGMAESLNLKRAGLTGAEFSGDFRWISSWGHHLPTPSSLSQELQRSYLALRSGLAFVKVGPLVDDQPSVNSTRRRPPGAGRESGLVRRSYLDTT